MNIKKAKQKITKNMVPDKTENDKKITFSFMHKNKFYREKKLAKVTLNMYQRKKSTKMERAISIEI